MLFPAQVIFPGVQLEDLFGGYYKALLTPCRQGTEERPSETGHRLNGDGMWPVKHSGSDRQSMRWLTHRIHAIYGNMDPINIPQMFAYIPYMDPMNHVHFY